MPNILKGSTNPIASLYEFPEADALDFAETAPPKQEAAPAQKSAVTPVEAPKPIDYAKLQADAIIQDAEREAQALRDEALAALQEELEEHRRQAREEGYNQGFAEGMAGAMTEARLHREQQAVELGRMVKEFLENTTLVRERFLEQTMDDMKDLVLAIAEKIIRVSLKSSSDIIIRMIQAATEKHRRREWVHIYIADCDFTGLANIAPELTQSLNRLSDQVRIIPMADDESGTCIIELPNEIIDASVSTQLTGAREILSNHRVTGQEAADLFLAELDG